MLTYDELVSHSNGDFDGWRLEHRRSGHRRGDDRRRESGRQHDCRYHAERGSIHPSGLHPRMVERVEAGRWSRLTARCVLTPGSSRPLAVALESYERRRDWGMIYPIKIALDIRR